MKKDPFTLIVSLSHSQEAAGTLYVDDGSSYKYLDGDNINAILQYKENTLFCKSNSKNFRGNYNVQVERIIVVGLSKKPISAIIDHKTVITNVDHKKDGLYTATLKKPAVSMESNWKIEIKF